MRSLYVCFFALLNLIGVSSIASAQSASVVGKNYESGGTGQCSSYYYCVVYFPKNPSTSVIKIERVSCSLYSQGLPYTAALQIADAPPTTILKEIALEVIEKTLVNSASTYRSTINAETSFLMGVNRTPLVRVEATTSVTYLRCVITGTIQ